ncbi:MAG: C39 family peptidase [Candidatus Aenigmarchaeota archaeon]|nr:C39 family peptidase [Candidatus Aenigmarchaeota archaeon]
MKKKTLYFLLILSCLIIIITFVFLNWKKNYDYDSKSEQRNDLLANEKQLTEIVDELLDDQQLEEIKETVLSTSIPKKINLTVPFTCQAPFANWDDLHNEACEEASILMLHHYLQSTELTPQQADQEIISLVNWQKENWGGHNDLPISKVAQLLTDFYGYDNVQVKYQFSLEDIKQELVLGHPVIIPVAGRQLPNPYYKTPGPLYHYLLIRGYQNGQFITNDSGTKRGKGFIYQQEIVWKVIHDLPIGGKEDILSGVKAMLVINN